MILTDDRIDISKGIDVNMTSASKNSIIFYHWYFLDKSFKFQSPACHGCRDVLIIAFGFNNIVISNLKDVGYCCILFGISKIEAKFK